MKKTAVPRSLDAIIWWFSSKLNEYPSKYPQGQFTEEDRTLLESKLARCQENLNRRIRILRDLPATHMFVNLVEHLRLKLTWIDFQAFVRGIIGCTSEKFTMKHFELIATTWSMREICESDGDKFIMWQRTGMIYGPQSTLGEWFANQPQRAQFAFLRKILNETKEYHNGNLFNLASRIKLVNQLLCAMRSVNKKLYQATIEMRDLRELPLNTTDDDQSQRVFKLQGRARELLEEILSKIK